MNTNRTFFGIACRVAVLSFLVAGTASLMQAQQSSSVAPASHSPFLLASESTLNPASFLDLSSTSSSSSSSSSSSADSTPSYAKLDMDSFAALGNSQPPPRRTYGRPHYSSTSKWTGMGGFGFNLPTGGTHAYASPSWRFQVGFGPKLSENVAILFQFDYDHFGMQSKALNRQLALYNSLCGGSCGFSSLGGNIHDWSFTLNPTFTLPTQGSMGAYAVVGFGFYHKYTQFTTPTTGYCVDPYFGYTYQCSGNAPVDWYTSNAVGVNGGLGFTWKFSRFANERLYAEARYVYTANNRRTYSTSANLFPAESAPTSWIPITFGIRF